MTAQTQRYEHDCQFCRFLGYHEHADLYYCPGGTWMGIPTVLARWSDEPADYWSGLILARNGQIPALTVALGLAIQRGLCDEKGDPK